MVVNVPGSDSLRDRVVAVFDSKTAAALQPLQAEAPGGLKISGCARGCFLLHKLHHNQIHMLIEMTAEALQPLQAEAPGGLKISGCGTAHSSFSLLYCFVWQPTCQSAWPPAARRGDQGADHYQRQTPMPGFAVPNTSPELFAAPVATSLDRQSCCEEHILCSAN